MYYVLPTSSHRNMYTNIDSNREGNSFQCVKIQFFFYEIDYHKDLSIFDQGTRRVLKTGTFYLIYNLLTPYSSHHVN